MEEKLKVFCFPYAGASSYNFLNWSSERIAFTPIELSGRGRKITGPLFPSIEEMVDNIFPEILEEINKSKKYALFGHSMGALVAYEVARRLFELGMSPNQLFVSGCRAPHIEVENPIYKLPDDKLMNRIIDLGGGFEKILADKNVLEFFLPIIKNDCCAAETYHPEIKKISSNITLFRGEEDELAFQETVEWEKYTQNEFNQYSFPDGHFFIHKHKDDILSIMESTLFNVSK